MLFFSRNTETGESEYAVFSHFTYKKILYASLSPIVMMLFTSLYSVADGLFLSNFAGKEPFAAVGFITPYFMMFNSVGFLFGTGGSALISKMLGKKKEADANAVFTNLFLATAITGAVLSVTGQLFLKPAAVFQGAEGPLLENSILYGRIYLLGTPACLTQFSFQALYPASGKGKLGLKSAVACGLTNILLDAVFLAVFSCSFQINPDILCILAGSSFVLSAGNRRDLQRVIRF